MFIDEQLKIFKELIEDSIRVGGKRGKESMIRSSEPINLVHEAVKYELMQCGVQAKNIVPEPGRTTPELKLAGLLKQKKQDVCVIPAHLTRRAMPIRWGPMQFQNKKDFLGFEYATNTLVINVRSQMSSLAKNSDTMFERTFAEAMNLHMRYPDMVLGEVYLIPAFEYDDAFAEEHKVKFKSCCSDVERYISFFNYLNNRQIGDASYRYEKCALLVVDFDRREPKLYRNSEELKQDGIISRDFRIEYATLGFDTFARDILDIYAERYDIRNLTE